MQYRQLVPIMLTFAVGMVVYFFYVAKSKRKPLFQLDVDRASLSSRSSYLGFWALILIAVVCLVGLVFPGFAYNYWTYPFVVLFVVALIGYSFNEKTHYARQLLIVAVSLVAGVAISLTGLASVNILVTLTIPLLLVAFFCLIYKLTKTIRRRSLLGQSIFALAVIVLLLGVFMSAGAKTVVTLNDVKINTPQKAMQFDIVVTVYILKTVRRRFTIHKPMLLSRNIRLSKPMSQCTILIEPIKEAFLHRCTQTMG